MADGTRLTHADVERIVQLVEDGEFGYVHFEADGLEVELVKEGYEPSTTNGGPSAAAAPVPAPVAAPAAPATPAAPAPATATSTDTPPAAMAADGDDPAGTVRSPMMGIFYRAPDPESPPYVEVGQTVAPGDTVGLVEVMKMFTAVRTEVAGRVVEILVENASAVDQGQPLVRVVES